MARAWLIRAGEDASALDQMRHAGVIAVRYPQIQADARAMTSAEVEKLIKDSGRTQPGVRRVRLEWFVRDVVVGDLVITPNAADREVWFAEVTGDYRYEAASPVPGYFHLRDVSWLGAIDRDHLTEDRRVEVSARPTIVRDLDHDWWRKLASSSAVDFDTRRGRFRGSGSFAGSSSKAAPKPLVLCAKTDCGLRYAASAMVDGLCPECHANR